MRRALLRRAKLALCFQIPSQASLQRILKSHRLFYYANGPTMLRQKSLGENAGLHLVSKRGRVVKKHLQARLRGSFPQQIQHSHSESTRVFYLYLTRSLPLISPFGPTFCCSTAHLPPVLGCGLKNLFAAQMTL